MRSAGGTKIRRPNCLSPATQIRLAADVYRYSTSDDDSGCVLDEYSWIPSGLKPDDVHTYFAALPNDKVPFLNSAGEKWRLNQLQHQLPAQDSDPSSLQTENERQEFQNFESARKRECLGRGQIVRLPFDNSNSKRYCHQCKQLLNVDELVVGAQRFGEKAFWHPKCFVCVECKELLVELIYYKHEDNVFCGRHHAEQIKPRCASCDELIFSSECTEAEGRVFHMKHFACTSCSCQLGGMKYVMRQDRAFCVPCYHKSITLSCNTCRREILIDQPHITQSDLHWHTDANCFCCSKCGKNLMGKSYTLIESALYCGQTDCDYRASKRSSRRNETLCPATPIVTDAQTPVNNNGRVRFEFRQPQPPLLSPPLPPVQLNQTPPENIYETLSEIPPPSKRRSKRRPSKYRHHSDDDFDSQSMTSCTSVEECCSVDSNLNHHQMIKMRMKQRKAEMRSKRQQRRSLSMDGCSSRLCSLHGVGNPNDEVPFDQLSLKQKNKSKKPAMLVQPNDYTRMPPDFGAKRPCSYASTSTSESDSDDDIYLNFSATMTPPQYIARQQQIKLYSASKRTPVHPYNNNSKRRHNSLMPTPRLAKKKSNANCFIS
ncbi:hypothetical protein M3Y97_00761200 [Aphelenchoides bicaudatus]|nr:hypothetical protein M3Y97_00761200 [Aphelenchoides bicaudatus]